jgi:hypothetical protein
MTNQSEYWVVVERVGSKRHEKRYFAPTHADAMNYLLRQANSYRFYLRRLRLGNPAY